MNKIIGEFIEEFPPKHHYLELIFNNLSHPNQRQWRNHRLSAYFMADYVANLLPIDEDDSDGENRIQECKDSVSYIANELIENAIKFNDINNNYPVKSGIYALENTEEFTAVIFTENSIDSQSVAKFQNLIQEFMSGDTHELYVQQIEKIAADEHSEASGIGLLTIINDYAAKLGWKFQLKSSNTQVITVMAMVQIIV